MTSGRLAVIRDGVDLDEEAARALWRAFSDHMERNRDDLEGFARDHGFVTVRAEHRRGRAVLIVQSTASIPPPAPRATRPATKKAGGASRGDGRKVAGKR